MIYCILIIILVAILFYLFNKNKNQFTLDICSDKEIILPSPLSCADYTKICNKDQDYCDSKCKKKRCTWKLAFEPAKKIQEIFFDPNDNSIKFLEPHANSEIVNYAIVIKHGNKLVRIDYLPSVLNKQPEHYLHYLEPGKYKLYIKSINEYGKISKPSKLLRFKIKQKTVPLETKLVSLVPNDFDSVPFQDLYNDIMSEELSNEINVHFN